MTLKTRTLLVGTLLGLLPSCLENEEEITFRPDGSASVRYRVSGDLRDLADGHPLPTAEGWVLLDAGPRAKAGEERDAGTRWSGVQGRSALDRAIAGASAARDAEEAAARAAGARPPAPSDRQLEAEFLAEFASAAAMPTSFAPASDPYASAFLVREQSFTSHARGAGRVHVFERSYALREHARYDPAARLEHALEPDLWRRLERAEALSAEEITRIASAAEGALCEAALALADDALLSDFTDASVLDGRSKPALDAPAVGLVRAGLERALAERITSERIRRILELVLLRPQAKEDVDEGERRLAELDLEVRETVRSELGKGLAARGLAVEAQNAIRAQLEWLLAAYDHTQDLGDERFVVLVRMPGAVVGGNFDSREGDAVRWSFEGDSLRDRPRVLRVVSVVE